MELTALALLLVSAQTSLENPSYFETLDGGFVPQEEGEAALRSGKALLVGGLLVGASAI